MKNLFFFEVADEDPFQLGRLPKFLAEFLEIFESHLVQNLQILLNCGVLLAIQYSGH